MIIVLAVALIAFGTLRIVWGTFDESPVAVITIDGEEYARLPLDTDTTVSLPTDHIVMVKNGKISVVDAPCPDRICVQTSAAYAVGQCITCLPERVVITVTEGEAA